MNGWLGNFTDAERPYADCLLNAFIYYSNGLTKYLFNSAFRRLATRILNFESPMTTAEHDWDTFTKDLLVTHVTGEEPNSSDSGYHFARLSRQFLSIPQTQIVTNEEALDHLHFRGPRPLIFVDDFVGSGNQFRDTWIRQYPMANDLHLSFQSVMAATPYPAYYCPVLCSWKGADKIRMLAPEVVLSPAHELDSSYSAITSDSSVWPEDLKATALSFLRDASQRAGITNWKGFHDLGLLVAFEDSVPDATLPLIYHESDDWSPLVRRR